MRFVDRALGRSLAKCVRARQCDGASSLVTVSAAKHVSHGSHRNATRGHGSATGVQRRTRRHDRGRRQRRTADGRGRRPGVAGPGRHPGRRGRVRPQPAGRDRRDQDQTVGRTRGHDLR